jgi:hypothetical protein
MAAETKPQFSRATADREYLQVDAIGAPIHGLVGRAELLYIVYPIEGLQRFWYHLNPRVYSEKLRIKRISEGRRARNGNRFVLFVFYARDAIPAFTQTVIDAIARRGLNLVISTNAKITPALREALLEKSCLLIERADLGRDFGGYKDGISIIERRFGTPDRLILLNDSLFYFEEGLDDFIAAFDGEQDLYAMTEVFEHHYHLGSFALSFGRKVMESKRLRKYWQSYRPISTRRWSVHKGEVALTQTLMRAGFRPHVLYYGARLLPHLLKLDDRQFLQSVRLLPVAMRRVLNVLYDEFQETQRSSTLSAINSFSRSMRRIDVVDGHVKLRNASIRQMLTLNHEAAVTHREQERWSSVNMCREVVATISARNQMHTGGFLFHKFLGMPALKRDIFFREVFTLEDVEDILGEVQEPLRDAMIADMRQKGTQRHFKGLARILSKHGSI